MTQVVKTSNLSRALKAQVAVTSATRRPSLMIPRITIPDSIGSSSTYAPERRGSVHATLSAMVPTSPVGPLSPRTALSPSPSGFYFTTNERLPPPHNLKNHSNAAKYLEEHPTQSNRDASQHSATADSLTALCWGIASPEIAQLEADFVCPLLRKNFCIELPEIDEEDLVLPSHFITSPEPSESLLFWTADPDAVARDASDAEDLWDVAQAMQGMSLGNL
ncbi:hypothetical protein AX16_008465 [Volvariella volvacea WC 439]|nr:hypothetical protein AX16_008465 [Volvariella volvacea WC 439]